MPSYRAVQGEEFDDYTYWVGDDPRTRAAFSTSARQVRGPAGERLGAALAYQEITDLMRAMQVQDEFVSSVSHELRTPLTSVLGYLEMLCEHDGAARRRDRPAARRPAQRPPAAGAALRPAARRPGRRGQPAAAARRRGPGRAGATRRSRRRARSPRSAAWASRSTRPITSPPSSTSSASARCWTTCSPTPSSTATPAAR